MRKIYLVVITLPLLYSLQLYSQKNFCADSSIRIKYTFNQPYAAAFNNYDITGVNIFTGSARQRTSHIDGMLIFKTNWADSIYWLKKFYLNNILTSCGYSFDAPNGTIICTGFWGGSSDLLLSRIDTNGNLQWAKRYRLSELHRNSNSGRFSYKNIHVTSTAIYFNTEFNEASPGSETYYVIGKLDLDGNLLWTKSFSKKKSSNIHHSISDAPVLYKDTVYVLSNVFEGGIPVTNRYISITKLSDIDGSLLQSIAFKATADNMTNGIIGSYIKNNSDTTFSIIGSMSIPLTNTNEPSNGSDLTYNLTLDKNLQPAYSCYYKHPPSLFLDGQYFNYDFNNRKEAAFLYNVRFSDDKYFVTFDENKNILRSRKLLIPPLITARYSVNFDDKQNLHFTYNYNQNNKGVIEYARISDLAAANTVSCFGEDTSILQPQPFILTQEPFTWDIENTNIVSSFPVSFLEETETITKEVICKQVSYCDSVKIKGKPTICLGGGDVRYTVYQNPECLKGIVWQTDTSLVTIVKNEADTAITLRPKKEGQFYLKATVNNCVITDSMLVTIVAPLPPLQLNRDSLLCPGSSILLSVNPLYKNYQWQDGSTKNTFTVTGPGLYRIMATDNCGNNAKDSLQVLLVDTNFNIAATYNFCVLDSTTVFLPVNLVNIRWQPSATGLLRNNELLFFPKQPTTYNITAQRLPGCNMKKTIHLVEGICTNWIRFPSAFTPNNDGLNDNFKPIVSGQLSTYDLKIFNRYGQLIFTSNNPYSGWNGQLKRAMQPNGVYVFTSRYNFPNGAEQVHKGTIMLIR